MLEIKKANFKRKCDIARCTTTNVYMIKQPNEPLAKAKFYCEDHLKEIARFANEKFWWKNNDMNKNLAEIETGPAVIESDSKTILQNNIQLKAEILELKSEIKNLNPADNNLLKANLESAEATNKLFQEEILTLNAEIKRLKQSKPNKQGRPKGKK